MLRSAHEIVRNNLGRRVRELRLSLHMSQQELAEDAETRRALISQIERGEANPTLDSIVKIATALGVEMSDLFDSDREQG
jgi:transcriptional regulator with XRE-family HTH domain